jgi:membrane-associated HD superfamily phosphohydrolase
LRAIVQKTIDYCQNESQLDKTTLTLNDLYLARESFVKTLQNTYHPRMKYPELTPPNKTKSALEDKE